MQSHTKASRKKLGPKILVCATCKRTQIKSYRSQTQCLICSPPRIEAWPEIEDPQLGVWVWFSLPLSGAWSKNRMHARTEEGGVIVRKEARDILDAIAWSAKLSLGQIKLERRKVWLEIIVQKTSPTADAVNVVDVVCDGVKRGIGVDDRYFSLLRLDWQLVERDPRIYIAIGQE